MWRILTCCGVVVSACGGAESTSVDSNPPADTSSADVATPGDTMAATELEGDDAAVLFGRDSLAPASVVVADALVRLHGDDGGFVALVSALERGYSFDRVSAAAAQDRVGPDGVIVTADGGVDEPAGQRLGVLVLPDDVGGGEDDEGAGSDVGPVGLRRALPHQQDAPFEPLGLLGQLRAELGDSIEPDEDPGAVLIGIIVELSSNGYGLDQIVEALILGDAFLVRIGACTALSRGLGRTVVPASLTGSDCSSRLAQSDDEDDVPEITIGTDAPIATESESADVSVLVGVYEGTVELVQCGLSCGFECPVPTTISIALGPDGTLTGGFDGQARWNANGCVDPLIGARNPIEGFWEEDGTLAFTSPNVSGFTAEGFVVGGALTAMLVESGTAENAAADGSGTVVQFDVEAVKTR